MTVTIYVRDRNLNRVALLDDFHRINVEPKFNDVGRWELVTHRSVIPAAMLTQPGFGIEVVYDGHTVISGPILRRQNERAQERRQITLAGVSDDVWLARRIAHMEPGSTAPPYDDNEHDVRTGQCSTVLMQYANVNAGPGAIGPRRVPGLVMGVDPEVGDTVTGKARLQVLIEFLRNLALQGGDLGFRIVPAGPGVLEFQVYEPQDRSATVKFSEELGNLGDFSFTSSAPEANYIYCGGGGEGTERIFREGEDGNSVATWGRIELFRDRRDTEETDVMDNTIKEELAEKGAPVELSIQPFDTPQQRYGVHYGLGDKVTVIIDGEPIVEQIRSVSLSYSPDGPLTVKSTIGTPGRQDVFRLFNAIKDLRNRVSNIERS